MSETYRFAITNQEKNHVASKDENPHSMDSFELLSKRTSHRRSLTSNFDADLLTPDPWWHDVIRLSLIIVPTLVAVAILASIGMSQAKQSGDLATNFMENIKTVETIRNLLAMLRKERGLVCLSLSVNTDLTSKLNQARTDVNDALTQLAASDNLSNRKIISISGRIVDLRLIKSITHCDEAIKFYTNLTEQLQYELAKEFYIWDETNFWNLLGHLDNILHANDLIGIKRAFGSSFFASGHQNKQQFAEYMRAVGAGEFLYEHTKSFLPSVQELVEELEDENALLLKDIQIQDERIEKNENKDPNSDDAMAYFDNMTKYLDLVRKIERSISAKIKTQLEERVRSNDRRFWIQVIVLTAICILCPLLALFYAIHTARLMARCRRFSVQILSRGRKIQETRRKTDLFLNRILPLVNKLCVNCKCDSANEQRGHLAELREQIINEAWDLHEAIDKD